MTDSEHHRDEVLAEMAPAPANCMPGPTGTLASLAVTRSGISRWVFSTNLNPQADPDSDVSKDYRRVLNIRPSPVGRILGFCKQNIRPVSHC